MKRYQDLVPVPPRPLNPSPYWALGERAPQTPQEWSEWGERLTVFLKTLEVPIGEVIDAMGTNWESLKRWRNGSPMAMAFRHLLGHLVHLLEFQGSEWNAVNFLRTHRETLREYPPEVRGLVLEAKRKDRQPA
jgi:hypothetical protein